MKFIWLTIAFTFLSYQINLTESLFSYRHQNVTDAVSKATESTLKFDEYLTNEQLNNFVIKLQETYPNLTKIYKIGNSAKGTPLNVLMISSVDSNVTLRPLVKLVANQYGNEAVGRQILIYLAQFLLENYPQSEVITNIVDTIEIHFLFSMNPDDFELAVEGECKTNRTDRIGRFPDQFDVNPHIFYDNRNGFINLWTKEGAKLRYGKPNKSESLEPEVEAVEKWSLSKQFLLSLDIHSGLMAVFYPYSHLRETNKDVPITNHYLTPDNEMFEKLAFSFAINHPSMNTSECNPLAHFGTIQYPILNSAFYRPTIGSMQDFNYFFANCLELSIHLSCCAYPTKDKLRQIWLDNKVSLINHLYSANIGIKGLITDGSNNSPLEGVFVHVHGNQKITISNSQGEYFRLLPEGPYKVTFEVPDYKNVTIKVLVDNPMNQANPFDIKMFRDFEESKYETVQKAKDDEEKNNLNKKFTGSYKSIRNDFESVPIFKYHNYDEMLGYLFHYHSKYPELTYIYRIDHFANPNITIGMNDWIGKEMLLLLIKHILESYGKNKEITKLVNNTRIHIIPSLDPEAFEMDYKLQETSTNKTRKKSKEKKVCLTNQTVQTIDQLFPDTVSDTPPDLKKDRARFMTWLDENGFALSGTLYDGQLLARLPFNTFENKDETKTKEDKLFRKLAESYVKTNKRMLKSKGCENDPCTKYYKLNEKISNGIVNGGDWKITNHTLQDYSYLMPGFFDLDFFLSCERKPEPERLLDYWLDNRFSLINFIKQIHTGVKGRVLNGTNGKIINNMDIIIHIEGTNKTTHLNSKGDYFRILLASITYRLEVALTICLYNLLT